MVSQPAIVAGCRAVRHDAAQAPAAQIGSALSSAIGSSPLQDIGNAVSQTAGDSTVSTDVEMTFANVSPKTIVEMRLGIKLEDGGYRFIKVPLVIEPDDNAAITERLARGPQQIGVSACSLVSVTFSDGTTWHNVEAQASSQPR